jgi:succinoglycan biosynthesis transport protein ExoP
MHRGGSIVKIDLTEFGSRVLNPLNRGTNHSASGTAEVDWSITQCAQALYRRRKLLVAVTCLGILIAALISWLEPRWYQSQAALELQGSNENFLALRDIYPAIAPGGNADIYLQTQSDILQQDQFMEQVVRRLHLQRDPSLQHRSWFHRQPSPMPERAAVQQAARKLKRQFQISFTRGSRVLVITAESRNPQQAADLANALAAIFIEESIQDRQQAARRTYWALSHELEGLPRQKTGAVGRLYEAMTERAYAAALASAIPQSDIRIVNFATPALQPYKPNLPLNFAIGAFGAFLLAAGWTLFREQTNAAIHFPGEAGQYLSVPELGAIPEAGNHGLRLSRWRESDGACAVERAAFDQRFSPLAEAFRATLASILSTGNGSEASRLIVITSAQPMEGKTTVVSNLGIALAEISHRVLLIDGDMRRPRLHKVFEQVNSWGLSDVLREKNAIEELPVEALVRKTPVPHLYLLPSGASTDNIFGLLYSGRLERLLPRFREEFDYVLIDAPPCLEFADARIMARYAETILLVIRAGCTGRQTTQTAVRRLLLDGISVLGVVLNRWTPLRSSDRYAYGYLSGLKPQESQ